MKRRTFSKGALAAGLLAPLQTAKASNQTGGGEFSLNPSARVQLFSTQIYKSAR